VTDVSPLVRSWQICKLISACDRCVTS
jgi:hypothetical protein